MNKQQAALYSLMTPEEQAKLHCLEQRKNEVRQFQNRVYGREQFGRKGIDSTANAMTLFAVAVGGFFLFMGSNMNMNWMLVAFILVLITYCLVLRQLNKRPSWRTLFIEGVQDYAPRALNPSALQDLKNTVQSTGNLDFHSVKTWFDEELFSAHVRINDLYARYQYAWFYQDKSSPDLNSNATELKAETVVSQCSTFIELEGDKEKPNG